MVFQKKPFNGSGTNGTSVLPQRERAMLKQGDTGEAIKILQQSLNQFGYGLLVDGEFGPKTGGAVRDFQESHHLVVDGIVGPITLATLRIPNPPPTQPQPPTNITLELLKANPADHYPPVGWHPDYDIALTLAAKQYPVDVPCSNVALFFKSVAIPESDFNRNSVYRESFGIDSLGLLQLSLEDDAWAHCGFKTREDVLHPIRNLIAGVIILHYLQKKYPGQTIYRVGGRYWSTLRDSRYWPGKSQQGYNRLRKYFNEHSVGCQLP